MVELRVPLMVADLDASKDAVVVESTVFVMVDKLVVMWDIGEVVWLVYEKVEVLVVLTVGNMAAL